MGTLPFFLVLFLFKESFSTKVFIIAHVVILIGFILVTAYISLVYWLDKFVITNHRIIYVDWRFLTARHESEAFHHEIQEIQTIEKGFFSYFKIFDYGRIIVETASAHININFPDAPDPEGIRRFIYHIRHPEHDSK